MSDAGIDIGDVGSALADAAAAITGSLPFLDHSTAEFAADPHTVLREAREQSWLVRTPTGLGVLTYAGCNTLLLDTRFRPGVFELMRRGRPDAEAPAAPRTLLGSEGADHSVLRRAVLPWFTPRRIETLRARTAQLASDLVDDATDAGVCEAMADIARPIPPTVFCWMVGCDPARGPELARLSEIALQVFSGDPDCLDDAQRAIGKLTDFARELIADKEQAPGDDLTSALLASVGDDGLSRRDVRSLLTELLSASVDNTTHSIGIALWLLAEHEDQWQLLVGDPSLLGPAVEECARFEPVVRHGNHLNDADADLLGADIAAGTLMTAYVASAHRDPAVYPAPDRFDISRVPSHPQLEFGMGRHYCIGAALARMEIEEVLRAVTTRWRDVRLGSGVDVQTSVTGAVGRLPLTMTAAT